MSNLFPPTHADLVKRAVSYLRSRRCVLYGTEVRGSSVWTGSKRITPEIPDAIGWTYDGRCIVVECKTSRSDFLADQKKPHRQGLGVGHERYYLAPVGVLTTADVPAGWGLLVVDGRRLEQKVYIHPRAIDDHDCVAATQLMLHLARRACDYDPAKLHAKIEEERAKQRGDARAYREALAARQERQERAFAEWQSRNAAEAGNA